MNRSFKLFLLIERIKISKVFNGFIYGLRKIPLVGKHLGDKYYFYNIKEFINRFIPIFSIIWQVVKSFLVFIYAIVITRILIKFLYEVSGGNEIFFNPTFKPNIENILDTTIPFLIYIPITISSTSINDNGDVLNELSKNFNFYPKDLATIFVYFNPFLIFLGRTLGFCLLGYFLGRINPIYTFIFSFSLFLYGINKTAFWTKIFDIREDEIIKNGFFKVLIIVILLLITSIFSLIFRFNIKTLSVTFLIINLVGLPFARKYLKLFNGYDKIIEKSIRVYQDGIKKSDLEDKDLVKIKSNDLKKKKTVKGKGFEYLNNLFFLRHRRLLLKPTIILTFIFILIAIGAFIVFTRLTVSSDEVYKILILAIPIEAYFLCRQNVILLAFYKNCDSSLIYYGFYREDKNLLKMFFLRFISIFKIMLIPMIAMVLVYILFVYYFIEKDLLDLFLPIFYIGLNGVFFTILPLFQYYLFQPFDKEGKQRSTAIPLMNMAVYYIFIFVLPSLIEHMGEYKYMIFISFSIIVFVIITSTLIYKFSPKTFKIKN